MFTSIFSSKIFRLYRIFTWFSSLSFQNDERPYKRKEFFLLSLYFYLDGSSFVETFVNVSISGFYTDVSDYLATSKTNK